MILNLNTSKICLSVFASLWNSLLWIFVILENIQKLYLPMSKSYLNVLTKTLSWFSRIFKESDSFSQLITPEYKNSTKWFSSPFEQGQKISRMLHHCSLAQERIFLWKSVWQNNSLWILNLLPSSAYRTQSVDLSFRQLSKESPITVIWSFLLNCNVSIINLRSRKKRQDI